MVCFSGMGGMTRVGCRLTSADRRDANSEYRRATSMSYRVLAMRSSMCKVAYSCAYSILDEAAMWTLAGICYQNLEIWVFI